MYDSYHNTPWGIVDFSRKETFTVTMELGVENFDYAVPENDIVLVDPLLAFRHGSLVLPGRFAGAGLGRVFTALRELDTEQTSADNG